MQPTNIISAYQGSIVWANSNNETKMKLDSLFT